MTIRTLEELANTPNSVLRREMAASVWNCVIQYRINQDTANKLGLWESAKAWGERIRELQTDYKDLINEAQALEATGN